MRKTATAPTKLAVKARAREVGVKTRFSLFCHFYFPFPTVGPVETGYTGRNYGGRRGRGAKESAGPRTKRETVKFESPLKG